ncbi:VacB/RNase II family 3'-5' exoribonuclease [Lujinxingia vulgaris]|uniref:VacB/RNase II family 3'-5' exoribonuclease n=1 Tax=Lujinxingia vulgaris TaxID=2600176 RepID=A0A5C6XJC0_9DELT|nr:ribonuclease R family protein [Lujinxingia vulgaris]TXD41221.1 VacB/RNase II family 3'-5' exoribonuclease [Lujinxingia vulgaris]
MSTEIEAGALIEFSTGNDHRLGVVTDTLGKKKLIVLSEGGDEMRPARTDVTFELGRAPADDAHRAGQKLKSTAEALAELKNEVDVAMLWEFAREFDEAQGPGALAELMFAEDSPNHRLALVRALRDDSLYFKARRDGTFEARDASQVEQLREQVEAEARKEAERALVFDKLADVLKAPEDDRPAMMQEAMRIDPLRDTIFLLQDFAAHGEDFTHRARADEALDELTKAAGRGFPGHNHLKAFNLMRELGLWDEHYNLALHRFRIDEALPEAVVEEAQRLADTPFEPESWRVDLSDRFCLTIDDASTRDIDDALAINPTEDGGWELDVHIADPSAIVPPDSLLDKEARRRATSVYLPTGAIPMFPLQLSEDRMSLIEGELRPAITTRVIFNAELEIVDTQVIPSLVRVKRRLTYDEADALLAGEGNDHVSQVLTNLQHIASERYAWRADQGATNFEIPEAKIVVDTHAAPPEVQIETLPADSPSRQLVSELMVLCNEHIGRFCERNEIPTIYRIQESPDLPLDDDEILAVPEGLPRTFATLRRMKRGDLSTRPDSHFGLGLHTYVQASSPIRRYSDLICQRQLKAHLSGEPLPYNAEEMLQVLAAVESSIREASLAERETKRYWLFEHLKATRGEVMHAIVLEIKDERAGRASVFVEECAYRSNCSLKQKAAVGDRIEVVADRVDARGDRLSLRQHIPPAEPQEAPAD